MIEVIPGGDGPQETLGLSQRESKAFIAGGYSRFAARRDPEALKAELLDAIRRVTAVLRT